ncbi:MAG: MFS transporter [Acidisphaera sp.]|nr:MFS transporter [Acidisphaera sp.]
MPGSARPYHVVLACFLGWTIDAFDFFIMIFVIGDIAREFDTSIATMSWAITLTLALRVVGSLLFGRLADRYGRRPALIANILIFSLLEVLSGFAPTLTIFLILRALYGIAMGGEWGVGASLTMESIPQNWRGFVSGILQSGYSFGYLLAALLYGVGFGTLGWRGMFIVAMVPALLVLYVRRAVPESPDWQRQQAKTETEATGRASFAASFGRHWRLYLYAIVLLTAAATFSHGTQDLYPVFLRQQHGLSVHQVSMIAVIFNIGAILGCLSGGALSQAIGRRRELALATLAAIVLMPFWAEASSPVMLAATAFLMQFLVQCTFGVMPAHLNEISPADVRATFPGFTYQFGNMLAAGNATIQAVLAAHFGGDYGLGLGLVAGFGAVVFCLLAFFGVEARSVVMDGTELDGPGNAGPDYGLRVGRPSMG